MSGKEYITRGEALDAVCGQFCGSCDETEAALNGAIEEINKIRAADVFEHVRGELDPVMRECDDVGDQIQDYDNWSGPLYTCSRCGNLQIGRSNFCPNCGADMREDG